MEVIYEQTNNTKTLTLDAENVREAEKLKEFASHLETFTGEMRHNPAYKFPQIILTKK